MKVLRKFKNIWNSDTQPLSHREFVCQKHCGKEDEHNDKESNRVLQDDRNS